MKLFMYAATLVALPFFVAAAFAYGVVIVLGATLLRDDPL